MRWLPKWVMLVRAVSRRNGRRAEVEKMVKDEAVAMLHHETVGRETSRRSGPISAIAVALHFLVHPLTRERTTAEASVERTRRPERDFGASRSPFEAGITGGFSLLMDNSHTRKRR